MDERIGRYELIGRLGAGGFATVYRAFDPALDGEVAIKLLADNWSVDPDVRSRFIQEAQLMRRLDNRRLVQVYDIGELDDSRPYFVMRLATLGTLEDRLVARRAAGQRATTRELRRLAEELASCLARVHGDGIVHRDLKPSNLLVEQEVGVEHGSATDLLGAEEFLVLGDFGLARDTANGTSALTIAGGSGGFAAPEQYLPTGRPDARADLYAASAVLLYAVTGEVPSLEGPADAAMSVGGSWSPELAAAFRRGLERDPDYRPATVEEWRTMMSSALDPNSEMTLQDQLVLKSTRTAELEQSNEPDQHQGGRGRSVLQQPTRRRRRWPFALVLVVLTAAVALVGLRLVGSEDGPAISGPDQIEAGESATFIAEYDDAASFTWADSAGNEGNGLEFVVDAVVPGELAVELIATAPDGGISSNTATVRVTESPDGPVIVGPETVRVGESAVYTIDDPDADTVEWSDASGSVATTRYEIKPTSTGSFTFSAVVVRSDGQRIGSTKLVEFVE